MTALAVAEQAAALARAVDLADGRLADAPLTAARDVLVRIGARSELAPDRTVVALMGATGSGKSSLFNALVGEEIARTAATRPTTRRPLGASWGPGATALLDWLDVPDRIERPADGTGLILLDLPDIDSTELSHREIAARMAEVVDVLVWVLDPQKYADAVVHQQYLRPMATHADVTLVVLNQVDLVSTEEGRSVIADLHRLLARDSMGSVAVLPVSARTGEGIADLRAELRRTAESKRARLARARDDLVRSAQRIGEAAGGVAQREGEISAAARERLLQASFHAAGIPAVETAVRGSQIRAARRYVGWVPIRWLARLRPDPLRRLHLDRQVSDPALARTSLPGPTPLQEAAVRSSAHALVAAATRQLPDLWRSAILQDVEARIPAVVANLDTAVAAVDYERGRVPFWWRLVGLLQVLLVLAAAAGGLWLAGLWLLDYLRMPAPTTPMAWEFPWPTVLLVGGLVLGALLAVVAMAFARLGAAAKARRVARRLREAVAAAVTAQVVEPLATELEDWEHFRAALGTALRR